MHGWTRSFLPLSAHKSNEIYNKIQNIWFSLPTYYVLQLPKQCLLKIVVLLNFCLCVYSDQRIMKPRQSVRSSVLFRLLFPRFLCQLRNQSTHLICLVGLLRIYVALAVFQPYRDLEAGDNQSLKIQVARRGIEPRTSCSASQELSHSATAAPTHLICSIGIGWKCCQLSVMFLSFLYTNEAVFWKAFLRFCFFENLLCDL